MDEWSLFDVSADGLRRPAFERGRWAGVTVRSDLSKVLTLPLRNEVTTTIVGRFLPISSKLVALNWEGHEAWG